METPTTSTDNQPIKEKRSLFGSIIVGIVGVVSGIYLLNPTMGVFELIPDNIPVFGNLDEAAAVALLISALSYFGVDLGSLFGRGNKSDEPRQAKGEVVD